MRKLLFTLCAAALSTVMVNGQTRLALYEEFSGEMCAPCAAVNPGLWTLISANPTKVMLIKYQGPYAGAGPIYNAYKGIHDARALYYSNNSGPQGTLNGGSLHNPSALTQSMINAASGTVAPFAITVTHSWFDADSITANISITTPSAYTAATANFKVRVALVEHLEYCTPPGSNGETDFHNVVREMYPDAAGTAIPNSWTATQTQTITINGKVPSMVDKANKDAILVVWIQNDVDKQILQATTSTKVALPLDAALTGCVAPVLACATTGSVGVPTTATLTNTGATTLTSATIYYKVDNGSLTSSNWVGSLAPGASTSVSIPAIIMTPGTHVVYDSVALPNGSADVNLINNTKSLKAIVRDDATPVTLPVSADFENGGVLPANWTLHDVDGDGANFTLKSTNAHNSSTYALLHRNYLYFSGEVNYAILPSITLPAGNKALDFYLAYAQFQNENDELEVVYSTDCGGTWTSVWSQMGDDMATHTPISTGEFVPADADWRLKSVDMSAVPAGAIVAFRATSDYGNNLYIDDVNLRTGIATGIRSSVVAAQEVSLFPNPAKESATLRFTLSTSSKVQVSILDAVGRTVSVVTDAAMQQGKQQVTIPTSALTPGIYNISIRTAEGMSSQRLSVVK